MALLAARPLRHPMNKADIRGTLRGPAPVEVDDPSRSTCGSLVYVDPRPKLLGISLSSLEQSRTKSCFVAISPRSAVTPTAIRTQDTPCMSGASPAAVVANHASSAVCGAERSMRVTRLGASGST
jgi:hypothetical protein